MSLSSELNIFEDLHSNLYRSKLEIGILSSQPLHSVVGDADVAPTLDFSVEIAHLIGLIYSNVVPTIPLKYGMSYPSDGIGMRWSGLELTTTV